MFVPCNIVAECGEGAHWTTMAGSTSLFHELVVDTKMGIHLSEQYKKHNSFFDLDLEE